MDTDCHGIIRAQKVWTWGCWFSKGSERREAEDNAVCLCEVMLFTCGCLCYTLIICWIVYSTSWCISHLLHNNVDMSCH